MPSKRLALMRWISSLNRRDKRIVVLAVIGIHLLILAFISTRAQPSQEIAKNLVLVVHDRVLPPPLPPIEKPRPKASPSPQKEAALADPPSPKAKPALVKAVAPKSPPPKAPKPKPTAKPQAAPKRAPRIDPSLAEEEALLKVAAEQLALLRAPLPLKAIKGIISPSVRSPQNKSSTESVSPSLTDYTGELVHRLKLALRLPEYGPVQVELRLNRRGAITSVKVTAGASERNRIYVQERLPTLTFPPFTKIFPGEEEHTFLLTLNNEL